MKVRVYIYGFEGTHYKGPSSGTCMVMAHGFEGAGMWFQDTGA